MYQKSFDLCRCRNVRTMLLQHGRTRCFWVEILENYCFAPRKRCKRETDGRKRCILNARIVDVLWERFLESEDSVVRFMNVYILQTIYHKPRSWFCKFRLLCSKNCLILAPDTLVPRWPNYTHYRSRNSTDVVAVDAKRNKIMRVRNRMCTNRIPVRWSRSSSLVKQIREIRDFSPRSNESCTCRYLLFIIILYIDRRRWQLYMLCEIYARGV